MGVFFWCLGQRRWCGLGVCASDEGDGVLSALAQNISWFFFQAIQQGTIKCNFSGVALGDSWISPVGKYEVFKYLSFLTLTLSVTLDLLCDFPGKT